MSDPCALDLTKSVEEGCSKDIGRKMCSKKPSITPAILKIVCILYGNQTCNLLDIRIQCMLYVFTRFCWILRISELLNIRRPDIIFHDDHMSIFIEKSKIGCYSFT